jgi:hypothetical protein
MVISRVFYALLLSLLLVFSIHIFITHYILLAGFLCLIHYTELVLLLASKSVLFLRNLFHKPLMSSNSPSILFKYYLAEGRSLDTLKESSA